MGKAAVAAHKSDGFIFCVNEKSILGDSWVSMYTTPERVPFDKFHFEKAMLNIIREPNINSTAILRADILSEREYEVSVEHKLMNSQRNCFEINNPDAKMINVDDMELRKVPIDESLHFVTKYEIVRRIIPRNPYKDAIMNQTCLVMNSVTHADTSLIIYKPHIDKKDLCPFYIPHVNAVAILLHDKSLSVHYIPFDEDNHNIKQNGTENTEDDTNSNREQQQHTEPQKKLLFDESERVVRTAYRLLQTSFKHSNGTMQGYEKRVNHDQVVGKVKFQDRYTDLKKKYSKFLVENWVESTDPKKHVFEDIGIAAFLIELWIKIYGENFKQKIQFRDLGCGNGVLCYILIQEGINGIGIDARQRKSWSIYPQEVKSCLKEQVIIPSVLLRPHPEVRKRMPHIQHNGGLFPVKVAHEYIAPATIVYSSHDLLKSPQVNIAEYPKDTFIIGNHSDELTCWIPLLGYPFMVIPCCSHNLSGQRVRYHSNSNSQGTKQNSKVKNSTYAGLVDHVELIAKKVGWKIEKEMLRIPSTRNAAIIGYENPYLGKFPTMKVYETIIEEGGADGWIQNTMALTKRKPRGH